jgi:hypothetical protein
LQKVSGVVSRLAMCLPDVVDFALTPYAVTPEARVESVEDFVSVFDSVSLEGDEKVPTPFDVIKGPSSVLASQGSEFGRCWPTDHGLAVSECEDSIPNTCGTIRQRPVRDSSLIPGYEIQDWY